MNLDRRVFIASILEGGSASLVPGMAVDGPKTFTNIRDFYHVDPNERHIGDVYLKPVGGNWEHHIFTVDLDLGLENKLTEILSGCNYIAGFGFQLNERKRITRPL